MIKIHFTLLIAFLACLSLGDATADRGVLRIERAWPVFGNASGLAKRGGTGPAIVPGNPGESLLIEAVNYVSLEMPPPDKSEKLWRTISPSSRNG